MSINTVSQVGGGSDATEAPTAGRLGHGDLGDGREHAGRDRESGFGANGNGGGPNGNGGGGGRGGWHWGSAVRPAPTRTDRWRQAEAVVAILVAAVAICVAGFGTQYSAMLRVAMIFSALYVIQQAAGLFTLEASFAGLVDGAIRGRRAAEAAAADAPAGPEQPAGAARARTRMGRRTTSVDTTVAAPSGGGVPMRAILPMLLVAWLVLAMVNEVSLDATMQTLAILVFGLTAMHGVWPLNLRSLADDVAAQVIAAEGPRD